jgi:D-alanine-D-alanine ligase-like ATP-grasp enzyme
MVVYEQHHVKSFIEGEILGRLPFNAHRRSGAHNKLVMGEAEKAGLTVREIEGGYYFYDGAALVGSMRSMISSLASYEAVRTCGSKNLTKQLLTAAGVPVPRGVSLPQDAAYKAISFFRALGAPVVVKPADGRGGKGVTCGIRTEQHFRVAWKKAVASARRNSPIIVEEHVAGLDVRVYIVGTSAVAAGTRLPPFVVGDGEQTVEQLMAAKQALRETNRYLGRMPIVVDPEWLENIGRPASVVPDRGEVVVLNPTVNLHQGGENVDVTDILAPELKEIAVNAVGAIPGLGAAGVDFLITSPVSSENAVVLEVNVGGNISVHHLPAYGEPVNVARAMVEEMMARAGRERRTRM